MIAYNFYLLQAKKNPPSTGNPQPSQSSSKPTEAPPFAIASPIPGVQILKAFAWITISTSPRV